jgi:prophage regulatory protein
MRLLSEKDLKTEKGVSYSHAHLRRLVVAGKFPPPLKIGENRNAWIEAEIDAWIKERVAERDRTSMTEAA